MTFLIFSSTKGKIKFNAGASSFTIHNGVEIIVCIRDDHDDFVIAKIEWITPICDVRMREAIGLLSALRWVPELNMSLIDFD